MATGQGVKLGTATGYIQIDTSSLLSARRVVIGAAKEMGDSARGFGQQWDSSAGRFRTSLSAIGSDLKKLSSDLAAIGVAGTVISAIGIKSASSIEQVELRFRTLLGSQEAARAEMERLQAIARDLNAPITETQRAFAAMLPNVKGNVAEAEKLVRLSIRLASIDPGTGGGVSGARFSIGEFLSSGGTDIISLAERFNISKNAIRAAVAETGNLTDALDKVLTDLGATEDFAREFGDTFAGAAAEAGDALNQALGAGIGPTLKNVLTPAIQGVTEFLNNLRESNPALLQFISTMGLLAAALPAITFGLGQVAASLATLRSLGVIRIGLLLAAPVIGEQIGVGLSRFLADRGVGDQRLRSDSGEDPNAVIGERMKQVVVVLVHTIVEAGGRLAGAFMDIKLRLDIGGATLQMAILKLAADLAQLLGDSDFADSLEEAAQAVKVRRGFLEKALDNLPEMLNAVVQNMQQDITGSITSFLFPLEEGGEEVAQATRSFTDILREGVAGLQPVLDDIAKLNEAFDLESSRTADTRNTNAQRELEDYYRQRARDIAAFNQQQAEADQQELEAEAAQIERIAELQEEGQEQRVQELRNFNKESRRLAEDHRNEILDIQREMSEGISDAIAARDGSAAEAALKNGQKRIDEENQQYNIQRQRRQEDLEDLIANLNKQTDERVAAATQELADMRAHHIELQQEQQAAFAERLRLEDEDRAIRLQRQQEDYAREDLYRQQDLQRKIQALMDESNLTSQWITMVSGFVSTARTQVGNAITGLFQDALAAAQNVLGGGSSTSTVLSTATPSSTSTSSIGATPASTPSTPSSGSTTGGTTGAETGVNTLAGIVSSIFNAATGHASGGPALGLSRINEEGMESALFQNRQFAFFGTQAQVLNEQATQQLLHGGNGGHTVTLDFRGAVFGSGVDPDEIADVVEERVYTNVIPALGGV